MYKTQDCLLGSFLLTQQISQCILTFIIFLSFFFCCLILGLIILCSYDYSSFLPGLPGSNLTTLLVSSIQYCQYNSPFASW